MKLYVRNADEFIPLSVGGISQGTVDESTIANLIKTKLNFAVEGSSLKVYYDNVLFKTVSLPSGGVPCTSIDIASITIDLPKDSTYQINATAKPNNTTDELVYTSNNTDKVTVSDSGLLTWVSGGTATVVLNCGLKEVTLTINCDELLSTVYTTSDESITITDDENYPRHTSSTISSTMSIMADEKIVSHNWKEITTKNWSVSGALATNENKSESHTVGYNTSTSDREIEITDTFQSNTMTKTVKQSYLTLVPHTWEIAASNTYISLSHKTNAANGGAGYNDRRAVCAVYDKTNEWYAKKMATVNDLDYGTIFIPANTTKIKLTWNSPDNKWYASSNVFTLNDDRSTSTILTRVKDAGWNFNTGVWEWDTSDIHQSLYMGIGLKYGTTRDATAETKCAELTWEDLGMKIELTQEQNWTKFRNIKSSVKVNKTTGDYATDAEIAANTNVDNAGRQGGETFNGKYYQFYDREGGYLIYDVENSSVEPEHHKLVCDPQLHWGSVCFSNIYNYTIDEVQTTVTTPLVFATGHYEIGTTKVEVVDVVDIENDVLVKQYKFENRKDDIICAWDFENSKCWAIGYEHTTGYAVGNWYIDEYTIDNLTDTTNIIKTRTAQYYIDGTANNTLQDCKYKDGYLYIATGWGSTKGQTVTVWKVNTTTKNVVSKSVSSMPTNKEAEGLALMDGYMIVTNDSEMYKVLYNFDTYRFTNNVVLTLKTDPIDDNNGEVSDEITDEYLTEHQVYSLPSNSKVFNGVDTKIDTGYKLFDTDKSFSFVIDFETDTTQPSGQSNLNTTIVSCFNDNNNGANLDIVGYNASTADSVNNNIRSRIIFTKPTGFTGSNGFNTALTTDKNLLHNRQKLLMSYNAETKKVNVYIIYSYNGTSNTYTVTASDDYTFKTLNYNVVLGCRHVNTTYDRYWKGIIYDFKIYDVALPNILTNEFEANSDVLTTLGCVKLDEVKETYPDIMNAVNGINGLYFSKNSEGLGGVIQTGVTPLYTDTIEFKFKTLNLTSNVKTLFCTRSNGAGGNSFSNFIVSNGVRADYDNPSTTNDTNRYMLSANTLYTYKRNKDGDSMNGSYLKAYKSTSTGEYTAAHPLMIGGSTSSVSGYADSTNRPTVSNYLTDMIVYLLAIKNSEGQYTAYLVACEDNKMVDLVTGNVITAVTVNNQNQTFNTITYQ